MLFDGSHVILSIGAARTAGGQHFPEKGGDANGYIFRAVSALFGTDWFCWSDYSDMQKKMTAPRPKDDGQILLT